MPLPIIAIATALTAGGSLVPHAAGGMIVTSAVGYVAGTYLSTAAIGGLLAAASATLGAGALYLSGVAGSVIGGAGIFGTTIGATGVTGALMSAGVIASTPIWVPFAVGGAALGGAVGLGYGGYQIHKLRQKVKGTVNGQEAMFSDAEAKMVEKIVLRLARKTMLIKLASQPLELSCYPLLIGALGKA